MGRMLRPAAYLSEKLTRPLRTKDGGVLRTVDSVTPFLTTRAAAISLFVFCAVYAFIFAFGLYYIYQLLRTGPAGRLAEPLVGAVPNRPMSVVHQKMLNVKAN